MPEAAHVGGLLDQLLEGLGLDQRLQQARALVIWEDVVGPQIAAHARAHKLREGVLEVCVDQPAWMQQLHLMKPQILRKLNDELGNSPLKGIYLKRGTVNRRPPPSPPSPLPWRSVRLEPAEKAEITNTLAGIEDPQLRQELESLLLKQVQLNKVRNKF